VIAFSHKLVPVDISKEAKLEQVIETTEAIPMGGTDCAIPMLWAIENKGIL
jgi:60 kDa SS-A/Ro ribonucleoprotein